MAQSYANSAYTTANGEVGVNTTQNTNITIVGSYANSAYLAANGTSAYANNTFYSKSGGLISGDVSITGNLVINGTTTTVNTTTVSTVDSLIKLASNNIVSDSLDIGFYGVANTGTTVTYHGLVRQAGTNNFLLFRGLTQDPSGNTLPAGSATAANTATLYANLNAYSATVNGFDIYAHANAAYTAANGSVAVNTTQNTDITITGSYANSAYTAANLAQSYANSAFTKSNTNATDITIAGSYANSAYTTANGSVGVNTTQNTNITIVGSYANSAYTAANLAQSYSNSAYTSANTNATDITIVGSYANSAYTAANLAQSYANSAYTKANSATTTAQAAFDKANTSSGGGSAAIAAMDTFTSAGGTTITLSATPATKNSTMLYINGVYQNKDQYTLSGSTITFTTAPQSGDYIEVTTFTANTTGLYYTTNAVVSSLTVNNTTRLTQSSTTGAVTMDLAAIAGLAAGSYSYPALQVDSYGRITTISNQTAVSSFNGLTGAVTLSSANVTTALGFTPLSDTTTYSLITANAASTNAYVNSVVTANAVSTNSVITTANSNLKLYVDSNITANAASANSVINTRITANATSANAYTDASNTNNILYTNAQITANATSTNAYTTLAFTRANNSSNTFVGTTGTANPLNGNITFASNTGVIISAQGNTLYINDSQDLRTSASPQFNVITYSTITGGNVYANGSLNGAAANVTGSIIGNNLYANTTINAVTANVTGSLLVNNVYANTSLNGNSANVTGIIKGGNIYANTTLNGGSANVTGNIISSYVVANNAVLANGFDLYLHANAAYTKANTGGGGGGATITDDTTTNATRYVLFTTQTSGSQTVANTSTTKLTYNPSTGTLSSTVVTASSDERLKSNIETIVTPIGIIKLMRGVSFIRTDSGKKDYGVIAQEIEKVLPDIVHTDQDGMKSVSYNSIIGFLIEAVKDLQDQIDGLKQKIK